MNSRDDRASPPRDVLPPSDRKINQNDCAITVSVIWCFETFEDTLLWERLPRIVTVVLAEVKKIEVTERWTGSWSRCTLQVTFKSSPVVGCHYFPPGLQSPSQLKNVTILRPVPSYTAWWQRHIGVNNLPKVVTQLCPGGNWTHDLLIASPM